MKYYNNLLCCDNVFWRESAASAEALESWMRDNENSEKTWLYCVMIIDLGMTYEHRHPIECRLVASILIYGIRNKNWHHGHNLLIFPLTQSLSFCHSDIFISHKWLLITIWPVYNKNSNNTPDYNLLSGYIIAVQVIANRL